MDRLSILDVLERRFSVDELKLLCFALAVDYEILSGDNKQAKSRELIQFCERRESVAALVELMIKQRPDLKTAIQPDPPAQLSEPPPLYESDEVNGRVEGDMAIARNVLFKGRVTGHITVYRGAVLEFKGRCEKNVVLQEGAIVYLHGFVERNVINNGGVLEVYGRIDGYLATKLGGTSFIDNRARVGILLE